VKHEVSTVWQLAVSKSHFDLYRLLADQHSGEELKNVRDEDGNTLLHLVSVRCLQSWSEDAVEVLVMQKQIQQCLPSFLLPSSDIFNTAIRV
jgi:hypothetical protein